MVSLGAVAACEDDPTPRAADFDAQAPAFDANRPPPADGGIPDTSVPDGDAGPGAVTVNVRNPAGQPIAGATVVFGSATGDVLQSLTSDATGTVTAVVPSGSQVTVVFSTSDDARLVTITAVEPGDVIVASDLTAANADLLGTVSVATQSDGGPSAVTYRYSSGDCSTSAFSGDPPPFVYGLAKDCVNAQGKLPVLAEAYGESGEPVGFQFAKNVTAPTDGGAVTPAFGAWSTAITQQTLNTTNLQLDGGSNYLAFAEIADGVMTTRSDFLPGTDAGGQSVFVHHAGYADAVQFEVSASLFYFGPGSGLVGNVTRAPAPTANGTTNVDFATRLPEITSSAVDGGAPGRPAIIWTPAASLGAADGTYVVAHWFEPIDGGQRRGTWTFVTPPSATSLTAPALPASVTSAPGAQADFESGGITHVITVEASFVNGYGDFRRGAGVIAPRRQLLENSGGMHVPALPVNGTVKFTAFTSNGD